MSEFARCLRQSSDEVLHGCVTHVHHGLSGQVVGVDCDVGHVENRPDRGLGFFERTQDLVLRTCSAPVVHETFEFFTVGGSAVEGGESLVVADTGCRMHIQGGLLRQARTAAEAMDHISHFYRVFHTAQYQEDLLELLLHAPLPNEELNRLNHDFDDLVDEGAITQGDSCDSNGILRPCLRFHIDKRRIGLLYQLIDRLNCLDLPDAAALEQPGQRLCAIAPTP